MDELRLAFYFLQRNPVYLEIDYIMHLNRVADIV